jgi:hypothetical protein
MLRGIDTRMGYGCLLCGAPVSSLPLRSAVAHQPLIPLIIPAVSSNRRVDRYARRRRHRHNPRWFTCYLGEWNKRVNDCAVETALPHVIAPTHSEQFLALMKTSIPHGARPGRTEWATTGRGGMERITSDDSQPIASFWQPVRATDKSWRLWLWELDRRCRP